MARTLKRSLIQSVKPSQDIPANSDTEDAAEPDMADTPPAFKRASSGAGSAWKSGALADVQSGLDDAREDLVRAILAGDQVIEIDPDVIEDPIGTDRRADWMEQESFLTFVEDIRENGQDMPILVWPQDKNWKPDLLDPKNLERVQFLLLAGRRRREAARKLGRPVRAVIASQEGRDGAETTFNMLVLRFRENDQREDLSPFERLASIGQMYEELKSASDTKVTAKSFADRIGVHESIVSRARAVFRAKDEILNAFKNVYELSFHDLQSVLSQLSETDEKQSQKPAKLKKLKVIRKVGNRNLSVEAIDGKLSIKTSGVALNKGHLEELGDVVAKFLGEKEAEK